MDLRRPAALSLEDVDFMLNFYEGGQFSREVRIEVVIAGGPTLYGTTLSHEAKEAIIRLLA